MSSVKHMMFLSKNVKTPLLLEVKVGFVYGLKTPPLYSGGVFFHFLYIHKSFSKHITHVMDNNECVSINFLNDFL